MSPEAIDLDDAQLMHRIGAGDELAFAALVERHSGALIGFIVRTLGRSAPADDLAQDCLLRVYRAAPRYEPTARFRTWLFTIAMNVCLNHKRHRARRGALSLQAFGQDDSGGAYEAADPVAGPRGDLERDELRLRVRGAVDALPPQQRTALVLARYEGLSLAEIAEVMGNTVMAVKSLLNRARENLRERLQQEMEDYGSVLEGRSGG